MATIVNVALILLAVIVLGGMIRVFSFPRILPEGFESTSKDSKKDKDGDDDKNTPSHKEGGDDEDESSDKDGGDGKGDDDEDGSSDEDKPSNKTPTKKKSSGKKKTPSVPNGPPVDFDKNMKNFLTENADNDELMGSLHQDAKALMKNQKQLMSMLQTTGPMLKSSMDMVKSFKGMFGGDA